MKISQIVAKCENEIVIVKDFEFDYLVLLGKKKTHDGRHLSFLSDERYLQQFIDEKIESVICKPDMVEVVKRKFSGGICVADNPKSAFFQIHEVICNENKSVFKTEISSSAKIDPSAQISDENVIIGENVFIGPQCVIKKNVRIDANTHIEENCIIGTPAFYYYGKGNARRLVKSSGGVHIGENVGIHTNVSVERGLFDGDTYVGDNCAIDSFTLIEHDCNIGRDTIIAGRVTLAGSVTLGENCYIGVGSTVSNNIDIGDHVKLSVGSAVSTDIPRYSHYAGNYAIDHDKFIKSLKMKLK